jgi:hypothetical protein
MDAEKTLSLRRHANQSFCGVFVNPHGISPEGIWQGTRIYTTKMTTFMGTRVINPKVQALRVFAALASSPLVCHSPIQPSQHASKIGHSPCAHRRMALVLLFQFPVVRPGGDPIRRYCCPFQLFHCRWKQCRSWSVSFVRNTKRPKLFVRCHFDPSRYSHHVR